MPVERRPLPLVLVLFAYVLPVLAVAALLALSGLWVLAVGLLVAEVAVSGIVVVIRRRPAPATTTSAPTRRPWIVPLVMLALLAAMVAIAVVAS